MQGIFSELLVSAHPETAAYCEQLTDSICAPLDSVIWNNQTLISSSTHLESLRRSRYGPVSGRALVKLKR